PAGSGLAHPPSIVAACHHGRAATEWAEAVPQDGAASWKAHHRRLCLHYQGIPALSSFAPAAPRSGGCYLLKTCEKQKAVCKRADHPRNIGIGWKAPAPGWTARFQV